MPPPHTLDKMTGMHVRSEVRIYKVAAPLSDASVRNDAGGKGHFGAPRGGRTHAGVDLKTTVGQAVYAPISGKVTKIGWANATHRYVEISGSLDLLDLDGNVEPGKDCVIRLLYVKPSVKEGDTVEISDQVGEADDLHKNGQYPDNVGQHIHVEIKVDGGEKMDPTRILPI